MVMMVAVEVMVVSVATTMAAMKKVSNGKMEQKYTNSYTVRLLCICLEMCVSVVTELQLANFECVECG